jgi:hypothetical protein
MGFSLSVHNAAVGVYSIARQDRTTATSIASRTDLAEAACFEALGWLGAGAEQVVVVCCEDPTPPTYQRLEDVEDFRYAWACRLRAVSCGGLVLGAAAAGEAGAIASPLVQTPCLRALAFLAGAAGSSLVSETGRYMWRRHA